MKTNKYLILSILSLFLASEVLAQRNRPSSGRTSSRTGSSSSSSGSSSSTVGSGSSRSSWGSGSSSSSSSSSSGSSWSSGGSSSSGGSWSSGGSSYRREYVERGRSRMRGRNTAPILQYRQRQISTPVRSGNVSALRRYHGGRYRVRRHTVITRFNTCSHSTGYYSSPFSYHSGIDSGLIYNSSWIMEPVGYQYSSGFSCFNNYPYYVHNGYRYRYSPVDICNYELVDVKDETPVVVKTFYAMECNKAFDACAQKRDELNEDESSQRYICMEKIDESLKPSDNYSQIPGLINNLPPSKIKEIENFLKGKTEKELFKLGKKDGYNGCKIEKSKKCNFQVTVDGDSYPMKDGSICSSTKKSEVSLYGCESDSQRENAACLFALAIAEGYCVE